MFKVSQTRDERCRYILNHAEQDIFVGVLLAAANLEWTLNRVFLVMGKSSTEKLQSFESSSLSGGRPSKNSVRIPYNVLWKDEIASQGHPLLSEFMDKAIKCPKEWKTRKIGWLDEKGKDRNGWNILQYAFQLRHHLVHGQQGSLDEKYGRTAINVMLDAFNALVDFTEFNKANLFARLKTRK